MFVLNFEVLKLRFVSCIFLIQYTNAFKKIKLTRNMPRKKIGFSSRQPDSEVRILPRRFIHKEDDKYAEVAGAFFDTGVDYITRSIYLGSMNFDGDGTDLGIEARTVEYCIKGIHLLNQRSSKPIRMLLNSGGGSVMDGFAIYDSIRSSSAPIDIEVYGSAMSMGAIILQAGRRRLAHPNATIMIHEGYSQDQDKITARASEAWAEWSKKDRMRTKEIFSLRTGKPMKYWDNISHDKIYDAREALKEGLIDEIVEPAAWTRNL